MKSTTLKQNTAAWSEERKKYIGSSDTPIILGLSPFKTALELYEEKIGKREPAPQNYATAKGHAMENVVRQKCEFRFGRKFEPRVFTEGFLIASLDGYSPDLLLEIKNPGREAHDAAKAGEIPRHYYAQVQHQMYCAGVFKAAYASYFEDDLVVVEVDYDREFMVDALKHLEFFKACVDNRTPPEPTAEDRVEVDDQGLLALAENYVALSKEAQSIEKRKKAISAAIKTMLKHPKVKVGDYHVSLTKRKGNVDYKAVPELKGVDLEPYRGDDVEYLTCVEK